MADELNAYELAKQLDQLTDLFQTQLSHFEYSVVINSINMLRQQADRIAELEKGLELVKDAYCARDSECRQLKDRIAEFEKDLALKTRDRDVFRDFTLAYEKRIEELEKLEQDFIRVIKQTNPNKPQAKP